MRIGNVRGRCCLIRGDGAIDVERASSNLFSADSQEIYERWDEFSNWAASVSAEAEPFEFSDLFAPVPEPRQVFGIGMNYTLHAAEAGVDNPQHPPTFTKFPSCIAGPNAVVPLPSETVDWEVELVVVVGRRAHRQQVENAWSCVAGVMVGQDISDRVVQMRPPAPQFCLGKSYPAFGPIGPWVVSPDELPDKDNLAIGCTLNGEEVQKARTSDLIFGVADLISELSAIAVLLPGDLIFTGTPSGVGMARSPQRFLADGDELVSTLEAVGSIRTRFVRTVDDR